MSEQNANVEQPNDAAPIRLRDALRKARIEAADKSGVVVDLRDAEVARLEILNEALDPLFAEIPAQIDLFDRGISQGETPRLWLDPVAHVVMGRDKRIYRLVQDTRFGRTVIAESHDVPVMVDAVTDYIARRMIEREKALVVPETAPALVETKTVAPPVKRRGWFGTFAFGFVVGVVALFAFAMFMSLRG